jgi:hypothetical protein
MNYRYDAIAKHMNTIGTSGMTEDRASAMAFPVEPSVRLRYTSDPTQAARPFANLSDRSTNALLSLT